MKKPIKRKPAARNPPALDKAIVALDSVERKLVSLGAAISDIGDILANRYTQRGDIGNLIDEMGRALSDQIILLAKELPPNRHDGIIARLDQLERRVNLLEREATYTVRHVIEKPREENHDAGTETPSGRVDREEPHDPGA